MLCARVGHCEFVNGSLAAVFSRTAGIELTLKRTFEPVIHLHLFGRSEIEVHVQVLQADGGTLTLAQPHHIYTSCTLPPGIRP